jgi:rSAM/selenodomain-associated transferase 2
MDQQRISVIIPTLNEEAVLPGLIQFLSRQPDVQIIVSDGGSSDQTLDICREYGVVTASGPPGRGRQLNRGASLAQAPVMLFLHADSRIGPAFLKELREVIRAGGRWGCATLEFDANALFYRCLSRFSNLRARLLNSCYGDQAIYCRNDFYRELGGYPDWPLLEDVEFSRRARLRSGAVILTSKVTSSSRRFEEHGRWKSLLLMQRIKLLYTLGVSPQKLSRLYRNKRGVKSANRYSNDD